MKIIVSVLAVFVTVGVLLYVLGTGDWFDATALQRESAPEEEPELRPVIMISQAEAPEGRPLVGDEGVDMYGYPTQNTDRLGILALLHERRFRELTEHLESFQKDFEEDFRKEYWLRDALEGVSIGDLDLEKLFNEWITEFPNSFVPYAARGMYFLGVASEYRGTKASSKTSEGQFRLMRQYHELGRKDLARAFSINPRIIAVYPKLMSSYRAEGEKRKVRALFDEARSMCPGCYLPALWHIWSLQPRWGGSMLEMEAFAKAAGKDAAVNPRLAVLAGFAPYEQCKILNSRKKYEEALAYCDEAFESGTSWYFHYVRGKTHFRMENYEKAYADFAAAYKLAPQAPMLLEYYVRSLYSLERWTESGRILRDRIRLDPVDNGLSDLSGWITEKLISVADDLLRKGERKQAIDMYELVLEIDIKNDTARKNQSAAMAGGNLDEILKSTSKRDKIAELEERSRRELDNFDLYLKLDYALARKRRFKEVVGHWDRFIARNPSHARAHLERGGAYFHLKDLENAGRDAERSCQLGLKEGCKRAQMVQSRMGR